MKKWLNRYSGFIAAFAIAVTSMTANSTCIYIMHQPPMPENAKKLRKF